MGDVEVFESEGCEVHCDARTLPVVFVTWFGLATVELVDAYFAWSNRLNERAHASGRRYVMITDTLEGERPSPLVRKHISELTNAQPDYVDALTIESLVVIDSPIMRGTLTALSWLIPDFDVVPIKSLPLAIDRAFAALGAENIEPPHGLTPESYRRPESSKAS